MVDNKAMYVIRSKYTHFLLHQYTGTPLLEIMNEAIDSDKKVNLPRSFEDLYQ